MYIKRGIEDTLKSLMGQFRTVTITGPRQSGKSTLARNTFPDYKYVSLENPASLSLAKSDPEGFLKQYNKYSIIDEVQNFPELLSYLQSILDEDSDRGQYILTGSHSFSLNKAVKQSLAGRTVPITLLPLNKAEIRLNKPESNLEQIIFEGGYPEIQTQMIDTTSYYGAYTKTYLERDLRDIRQVEDLSAFRDFMVMVAARSSQIMNYSSISAVTGYSIKTIKQWLSILETSYIIYKLPAYSVKIDRQLSKAPKYCFIDTGLMCNLLGIFDQETMTNHPLWGSIFETYVLSETYKSYTNNNRNIDLHYLRDKTGNEIDLVERNADKLTYSEIKASYTFKPEHAKSLNKFDKVALNNGIISRKVIYRGAPLTFKNIEFVQMS
jgi:uncharacterized protein